MAAPVEISGKVRFNFGFQQLDPNNFLLPPPPLSQ